VSAQWWVRLAEELWPRSTWNDQIRKLWGERLRSDAERHPEAVAQCIRNVRCARSSERVEIAWVLSEYAQYQRNQRQAEQGQTREEAAQNRLAEDLELQREVADEHAAMRTAVRNLPEEWLEVIRQRLKRYLPASPTNGDPIGWSMLAVGLAHAIGVECGSWSTPSPEPSHGLEPSSGMGESASTDPPRQASSSSPAEVPHGTLLVATPGPSADLAEFW
jgi:hypothetical protein